MTQKVRIENLKVELTKKGQSAKIAGQIYHFCSFIVVLVGAVLFWYSPGIALRQITSEDNESLQALNNQSAELRNKIESTRISLNTRKEKIIAGLKEKKPAIESLGDIPDQLYKRAKESEGFYTSKLAQGLPNLTKRNRWFYESPYIETGAYMLTFKDEPSLNSYLEGLPKDIHMRIDEFRKESEIYQNELNVTLNTDKEYTELTRQLHVIQEDKRKIDDAIDDLKNPYGFSGGTGSVDLIALGKLVRDSKSSSFLVHLNFTRYGSAMLGLLSAFILYSRYRTCTMWAEHYSAMCHALTLYETDLVKPENALLLNIFMPRTEIPSIWPSFPFFKLSPNAPQDRA